MRDDDGNEDKEQVKVNYFVIVVMLVVRMGVGGSRQPMTPKTLLEDTVRYSLQWRERKQVTLNLVRGSCDFGPQEKQEV